MQRDPRPELQALETAQVSSHAPLPHDHALISPVYSLAAVPAVSPEPAYIAASAASQIVTSEYHSQHPEWEEESNSPLFNEVALVSSAPLSLINAFLDRLLFNFLASARSTSLASLRPAVVEVLKPRLAKEAIAGADEELQEFLGGGDDEELLDFHNGQESGDDWDVEMVWKRTRLRCMVFTRLGDMEEEDEDIYMEQEHLEDPNSPHRLSRDIGIVSPAVAIFLTSILEFIGEHALMIAGEAAYRRSEIRARSEMSRSEMPQRLIVEETDMEKVALNPILGRLWRSWRKLLRSPKASISRILSRETVSHRGLHGFSTSRSTSRQSSFGTTDGLNLFQALERKPSSAEIPTRPDPASIPLPLTDYDVAEIEVPGYSPNATTRTGVANPALGYRSMSTCMFSSCDLSYQIQTPVSSAHAAPAAAPKPDKTTNVVLTPLRRSVRSRSLPTPNKSSFVEVISEHVIRIDPATGPAQHDDVYLPAGEQSEDRGARVGAEGTRSVVGMVPGSVAPFHGLSVLNAISKHAARELEGPSDSSSDKDSQDDQPTEIERHGHHEDNGMMIGGSSKILLASLAKPREDAQTRYSASSSVPSQTVRDDVSPMEPMCIESGEVSPIDPSDDEDDISHYTPARAVTLRRADDRGRLVETDSNRLSLINAQSQGEPELPKEYSSSRPVQGRQRGTDGPTEDDYAKDEKREAFVVLDDLPSTESARNSDVSVLSAQDLQPDGTRTSQRTRPSGQENGIPTLAPLREMVEASHDTSDEASSVAPSLVERAQQNSYVSTTASAASSIPAYATAPLPGSKLSDLRRQLPSVYTGAATERASVQRVSPSPGGHGDPITPQGRSSESSYRDIRSTYIATSGTSPVLVKPKARAGSHSGQSIRGPIPSRTPSDGSKTLPDERYQRGSSQSGEKERTFDDLINSDETIQYTLTPQNMREMEGPDSPRVNSSQSSSRTTQAVGLIRSGRSSTEQSQIVTGRPKAPSISKDVKRTSESNAHNFPAPLGPTFVIHSGPPVKRGPQAQARDARIENDNTRDFADFIRSTGPEQVKTLPRLPEKTGSGSRPTTAVNGSRPSPKRPVPTNPRTLVKAPLGLNPIIGPLISENKALKKGGTRLQAREPTISRNDETSELIDFIRQGPPADPNEGKHRIPRTIAPFRNTLDSDDLQPLGNGKSKDANSVATTHSSVHSRTGLLDSSNRQKSKAIPSPPAQYRPSRFNEPAQPAKRKQRRVQDPYAVSDSDQEDEASYTPTGQNQEESLLDFLNSVPPPPESYVEPSPLHVRPTVVKGLQRKTSASMRSRFSRSASSSTSTKTTTTTKGSSKVKSSTSTPIASHRGNSTSGRPQQEPSYPGQQNYRKADSHSSVSAGQAANMDHAHHGISKPVAKPIQARPAARNDMDNMRDLADFLKNSGPPEPVGPPSTGQGMNGSGMGSKHDSGGFTRMFSRRKRSIA